MKTVFGLMMQYDGLQVVPLDRVCRDYFPHMTPEHFVRRALAGDELPPVVRMDGSQKATKGVSIHDLAAHLDKQIAKARKEAEQLRRSA